MLPFDVFVPFISPFSWSIQIFSSVVSLKLWLVLFDFTLSVPTGFLPLFSEGLEGYVAPCCCCGFCWLGYGCWLFPDEGGVCCWGCGCCCGGGLGTCWPYSHSGLLLLSLFSAFWLSFLFLLLPFDLFVFPSFVFLFFPFFSFFFDFDFLLFSLSSFFCLSILRGSRWHPDPEAEPEPLPLPWLHTHTKGFQTMSWGFVILSVVLGGVLYKASSLSPLP